MSPLVILLIVLGVFGFIAIVAFVLYKVISKKNKEQKPDELTVAKQELDRILEPIEDKETIKAISEYKDNSEEN